MTPPLRWRMAPALLATLLLRSAPAPADDCNRNGVEDLVEIARPAADFRLVDQVDVQFAMTVVALDFDGDGDDDLVADGFSTEGLVLLQNDGAAHLAPARSIGVPSHSPSVRAADLDGDSDPDLVVAVPFAVEIRWNDGDGSFARSTRLPVGSGPVAVEAADLDRDADLDLVTANFVETAAAQNISVLINEGAGSFAPPRNFASIEGNSVLAVADPDGDGDADVLVSSLQLGALLFFENDGRAAFRAVVPAQGILGVQINLLAPADLDGDGRDEVLALGPASPILVLSHVGGGRFEVKDPISVPGSPLGILARDVTGDGRPDLVVSSDCPDFTVLEGDPGGFREPRPFWLELGLRRLIAAHLDGDGLVDLAGVDFNGVFSLVQEPSTLSRDCNRNGVPDGCEPDCDRNGSPDACDLSSGASPDCDGNGIPDACDPDCNANGIPDACDIEAGRAADCDANGVPDGCEVSRDADGNGSPDACDIARDPALDCDRNGKLDVEDLEPRPRFVQEEYELGIRPWLGRLADMDGDGDEDIVAGGDSPGISILEQLEDGSFALPRRYERDIYAQALAVLDADRDGDLDVAVSVPDPACGEARGWVTLLVNRGELRFGQGPAYEFHPPVGFLEPRDLDGDGILDLLAAQGIPHGVSGVIWSLSGRGDGTFAEPLRIGEEVGTLVLADLEADGDVDVVSGGGAILLNDGGGNFAEGMPLAVNGLDIAAGDVDGDSDVDLVIQTHADLWTLLNDGRARFTPGANLAPANVAGPLAVGDLDGDGRADIAVGTLYDQAAVAVLLSRDTGFVEVSPAASVGSLPSRLVIGDVDGDRLDDLVALLLHDRSAIVLKNRRDGVLSARATFAVEQVVYSSDMGDLDGDRDLDIVSVVSELPHLVSSIAVFENDGNASYALKESFREVWQARAVRLADMDGDGRLDLVVEESEAEGMGFSILENRGGGSFALDFHSPRGPYGADLAVTDLDADGDMDVARLHLGAGEISVVLNDGGKWGDPVLTLTGLHSEKLCVADAGGDMLPDLFAVGFEGVWIHRGAGGGRFEAPADVVNLPGEVSCATAADIDADGDDDLVVGRRVAECDRLYPDCWRLNVYLNVQGAMVISEDHLLDGSIVALVPADMDGDADLDLLAAISSDLSPGNLASHIRLFLSSDRGLRRGGKITVGGGGTIPELAARDLDGDGDPDVAFSSGSGFSVIRNDPPPPALRDADRDGVPDGCERAPFSRGDADQDGSLSLGDAVAVLRMLFQGAPLPDCPSALDADDSGALDITDPVRILGHLFLGRGPLPGPFGACGQDPTPDSLRCSSFGPCA